MHVSIELFNESSWYSRYMLDQVSTWSIETTVVLVTYYAWFPTCVGRLCRLCAAEMFFLFFFSFDWYSHLPEIGVHICIRYVLGTILFAIMQTSASPFKYANRVVVICFCCNTLVNSTKLVIRRCVYTNAKLFLPQGGGRVANWKARLRQVSWAACWFCICTKKMWMWML